LGALIHDKSRAKNDRPAAAAVDPTKNAPLFEVPTSRNRRCAQHGRAIVHVRAPASRFDLPALRMHAGDAHRVGPQIIVARGRPDILVDQADLSGRRQATTSSPCGGMSARTPSSNG
jgi:hypothetical protein